MESSGSCEAIAVRLSAWHAEFCLWLCFGACAIAAMMEAGSVKHAVREACNLAEVLLPSVLPRRLKCYSAGCRFVVYTDGAYENGRATWGAIVWDKQLPHPIMF